MLINALSVIIGILGTIALSETMSFSESCVAYTNSLTAFTLGFLIVCSLRYVYGRIDVSDKWGKIWSGIYSFCLAFSLTAGKQLHTVENFTVNEWRSWIQILILGNLLWGYILYLFQKLSHKTNNQVDVSQVIHENEMPEKSKKQFFFEWLVIFACWIPVFLAFYPGAFVYDAQDEYVQVATRTFSTHHPLMHVLLLGGFVCLGNKIFDSFNVGIAMYTIFQMLVLSGIFAYTVSYLRTKLSKNICMVVILFYGFFPVIPMYAVCSAKDMLFNGMFLLMLVQMLKLMEASHEKNNGRIFAFWNEYKNKKCDVILFIVSLAGMMLLRNNGKYVILAMILIIAIITIAKKKEHRYLVGFVVFLTTGLLLYKVVDTVLILALHADGSENQEILTVPIQQLARTYKYSPEAFSEEEREILFSYITEDSLAMYDADLSDLVKVNFNNIQYNEDSSTFWKLWFQILKEKPIMYLNAWFMTSYGYWYPDTIINVYEGQQRFTFQYADSSYFGFETEQPGIRDSKFLWLEEQYRRMSLELYQQKIPMISMAFSPGFMFWVFMGSLLLCVYRKKYKMLIPMGAILLLWGTAILGPTFLVRYVLILWFALPIWCMLHLVDYEKVKTLVNDLSQ